MLGLWVIIGVILTGFFILSMFWTIDSEHAWATGKLNYQKYFDNTWPPISDEDYLSRCPKGLSPEVALKVRRVISDSLDVPYDQVYPEQSLIEDLGAE